MSAKYLYAFSATGESIHISNAKRGCHGYTCRYCGKEMTAKKGSVNVHHFAHRSSCTCDCWYHGKGEWHREMQDLFPKEFQEVILENNGEKHIADICMTKGNGQRLVIEFQDSPMSREEFITRTIFWKSNNADMIWVFNLTDKDVRELPYSPYRTTSIYEWKRPFYTLGDKRIASVPIFFQINPLTKTCYKWHHYADFESRLFIEGGYKKAPILVEIVNAGSDFCVRVNVDGEDILYQKDGYGLFEAEICNDFIQYVKERMQMFCEEWFLEYNHDIWIRFESKSDVDILNRKYIHEVNDWNDHSYKIICYVEKEKSVKNYRVLALSEKHLIQSLVRDYGEKNVMIGRCKM